MNILLFVIQDTYIGGAEGVLHQVSDYYLHNGHQVYVLFAKSKKYGHWENNKYSNLHLLYGGGIKEFLANIKKLRSNEYDYAYSSLVDLTGILGLLKLTHVLIIKKMVGRESTSIFDRFTGFKLWRKKLMYHLGYPAVNLLICQTGYMKDRLLHCLPWIEKHSKVVVIPNPVDAEEMARKGAEELETKVFQPYIVTAGRFIPEKGYDILVEAFARLHNSYKDYHLMILGDGNLRNEIENQIIDSGLEKYVHLLGFSTNVYPWFRNAKLCVISSRVEGFPNVLLQMMSQNNSIVSTLCAGDIENIKGLHTCDTNSPVALEEAMKSAITESGPEKNRVLFDEELRSRSISCFIKQVENN